MLANPPAWQLEMRRLCSCRTIRDMSDDWRCTMKPDLQDLFPMEMMLINQYLKGHGCSIKDLCVLPHDAAKKLMTEACKFASARLAEIDAKTQFRIDIHQPGGEG